MCSDPILCLKTDIFRNFAREISKQGILATDKSSIVNRLIVSCKNEQYTDNDQESAGGKRTGIHCYLCA